MFTMFHIGVCYVAFCHCNSDVGTEVSAFWDPSLKSLCTILPAAVVTETVELCKHTPKSHVVNIATTHYFIFTFSGLITYVAYWKETYCALFVT